MVDAWVFDIDGTVALHGDRGVFEFDKCAVDTKCEAAFALFKALSIYHEIIFCTTRYEKYREVTSNWLSFNNFDYYDELFMKRNDDRRSDYEVKQDIYLNQIKPNYNVIGVIDDLDTAVNAWRDLGLTCLQIRPDDGCNFDKYNHQPILDQVHS